MKKKNAFTLIELLAVIVILAIIALIATPLTINVINTSKEKSFINSVYGLLDGARLLSAEQLIDNGSNEVVVNFTDGSADNENFKVSGDMPSSGTIYLNSDGKVELKVWSEELGKCAEKGSNEAEVKLTETTKEECRIEIMLPRTFEEVMENATGETATLDPGGNLRYVGPTPNNYVSFNGELWRIIGVFNGQPKIIRNDYYELDDGMYILWAESYSNNWATASLQLSLNNTTNGYITTIENNDPTSYSYIDLKHVWNIGAYDYSTYTTTGTRSAFYTAERSETPAGDEESDYTWTGAIGLIYPSDYGYASSGSTEICDSTVMFDWGVDTNETAYEECAEKSWLYDYEGPWTITSLSDYSTRVFIVDYTGEVDDLTTYSSGPVRPVLYLKSSVKIAGGLGTYDQPYELVM